MPIAMTRATARRVRARSQLLDGSALSPTEVVHRAVALQGQNLPAVLRAIALRSAPGTTVADVRAAFDAGGLVRSWPMRGTLFVTTPAHLATLLAHTGQRTHRAAALRRDRLGIDAATLDRARDVLVQALADSPLTRSQALEAFAAAGLDTAGGHGYHLLMHLCVEGVAQWGPFAPGGTEQCLVARTAPPPADPDAALVDVTRSFVASRGPVTEADLAWWTKLPLAVLRPALAAVEDMVAVDVEGTPALVVGEPAKPPRRGVDLLPGFDEWILGYTDRSLVASPRALEALVPGGNGIFRPAVLVDGQVVGTWRAPAKRAGTGGVDLVEDVPAATRSAIDAALLAWPHDPTPSRGRR